MVRRKKPVVLAIVVALSLMITGCKASLYEKHKSEYTPVTAVDATEFEVLTSLVSKATAISNISESETYDGLYIYKDGSTRYVLFDTTSIVVAVGPTEFAFKGNETEETLEAHSIENVWMKGTDGSFKYKSTSSGNVYKIVAEVDAQYALTPTQYCTLHGMMASVSDGNTEYSMFAGAVGEEMTSSQKKSVEHMIKSLRLKAIDASSPEEDVESNIDNDVNTPAAKEQTDVEENNAEESTSEQNPPESSEIPDEVEEENATEETEENTEEPEEQTDANDQPDAEEQPVDNTSEKEPSKAIAAKPEGYNIKPKQSTAFTPLSIDEWGVGSVMKGDYTMDFSAVHIDNIYTGEEATRLIEANGGRKTEPKEGTSFVVAEYTTDVSCKDAYLDIRFCGVDGEKLVQRGISYTQRTYDMLDSETKDTTSHQVVTYSKRYVYYEVPTGCKEYLLSFGYRIPGYTDQLESANYLIKTT